MRRLRQYLPESLHLCNFGANYHAYGTINITTCKGQGTQEGDAPRGGAADQGRPVACSNLLAKISPERVDAAFAALGYEEATTDGITGYLAVRRKPEEIQALGRLMAHDAIQQKET